ncbi:MAG: DUF4139 domain-containing protein [Gemmatimonadetes bacterium]|nr:DUF4139 domain-containing protein [Gemmatimonadota bacterium]MDA1102484.1 DUF4139 domain-containing protein [Gemmatimonadota bacterium]
MYNQNFGLVREVRTLDLSRGRVTLEFGDVASGIQPETVHISPLGGRPLQVLEQNYQFDLLSPQKLLEKYVGRTVNVYRTNPLSGVEEALTAEVLSVNGGTILRIGDEITFNYPGRFGFPEVPDNLISEPTLLWGLDAPGGRQQIEVTYLTNNLNWKSDYVMVLNEDDDEASLTGWVTLTNQSGTAYENARLQLVAGDVQRVSGDSRPDARRVMMESAMMADEVGFTEAAFFEYHLYTLGRPADLLNNEQKQVTLLESDGFGVEKKLVFQGQNHYYRGQYGQVSTNQKVGVFLDFENSESNGLGMPLPKGIIRVYKQDHDGAQQFIGEDLIDHTPRDEVVRIKMGEAFDVVADRRQMDYTVVSGCVSESSWRIDLRNHKDESVDVTLIEPVGGDWEILSSSHAFEQRDAWTFSITPEIEARGEVRVEYRVRARWC